MVREPMKSEKKSGGFWHLVAKTALVLLVLYAIGSLISIRVQIERAEAEAQALAAEADLKERTLDMLLSQAGEEPSEKDMLDAAHEAGYVLPGEQVFEDANLK